MTLRFTISLISKGLFTERKLLLNRPSKTTAGPCIPDCIFWPSLVNMYSYLNRLSRKIFALFPNAVKQIFTTPEDQAAWTFPDADSLNPGTVFLSWPSNSTIHCQKKSGRQKTGCLSKWLERGFCLDHCTH